MDCRKKEEVTEEGSDAVCQYGLVQIYRFESAGVVVQTGGAGAQWQSRANDFCLSVETVSCGALGSCINSSATPGTPSICAARKMHLFQFLGFTL